MALINLILQGKGGVGKSFVASLLTQHYKSLDVETVCVDTDPVNGTFLGYESYGVRGIEILDGDDINPRAFDELIQIVMETPEGAAVIVDNGAATFVPLCSYLIEAEVLPLLKREGHEVRFHAVLTGGQGMHDTLKGFDALCGQFPEVDVAVWRNEFFGALRGENGTAFEDLHYYKKNLNRIVGPITLPALKPETFGRDIEEMLRRRLSFDEAIASPEFYVMSKQRLVMYRRAVDEAMSRELPAKGVRAIKPESEDGPPAETAS